MRPNWYAWLTNGDVCSVQSAQLDEDELRLQMVAGADWTVPLVFIRGLARAGEAGDSDSLAARHIRRTTTDEDTLLLVNGDRVEGELRRWDASGLVCDAAAGPRLIPTSDVAGLQCAATLTLVPPRGVTGAVVQTTIGDRISCAAVELTDDQWRLQPETGGELCLPMPAVARIDFFGERVRPLTHDAPVEFESFGSLSAGGQFQLNRNIAGGPLSLRGDRGGWGLGTCGGSRLAWELDGTWSRFEAGVGLDDAAGSQGSVEFVVRVNGVERARTGVVRGGDAVLPLGPIDLSQATRLELLTLPADRGDVCDVAAWLRPTLMK